MEIGGRILRKTAGRRAAVVEKRRESHPVKRMGDEKRKSKEKAKKKKSCKNSFDIFGGLAPFPSVEKGLKDKTPEMDVGNRSIPAPYRLPQRNLFSKTIREMEEREKFENQKKLSSSLGPAGGGPKQASTSFLSRIYPTGGLEKETVSKEFILGPIRMPAGPPVRGTGASFSEENMFWSLGNLTSSHKKLDNLRNFSDSVSPGTGKDAMPIGGGNQLPGTEESALGVPDATQIHPLQSTLIVSPSGQIAFFDVNEDVENVEEEIIDTQ